MEGENEVYELFRRDNEKELSEVKKLKKVQKALDTPSSWTKLAASLSVKIFRVDRLHHSSARKSNKFSGNVGWEGLKREKGTRADRLETVNRMQQKQGHELRELREMGVVQESLKHRKRAQEAAREMFHLSRRPYNLKKQANVLVNCREPKHDEAAAQFVRQTSHAFVEAFFGVPSQSQRVLERLTAQKLEDLEKTKKRHHLHKRRQARASDREITYREHDDDSSAASTPVNDRPKKIPFVNKRPSTAPDSTVISSSKRSNSPRPLHDLAVSSPDALELDSSLSGVSTDTVTSAPVTPAGKPGWYLEESKSDRGCALLQEKDGFSEARTTRVDDSAADSGVNETLQSSNILSYISNIPTPTSSIVCPRSLSPSESECSDESRGILHLPRDGSHGSHASPSPETVTETTPDVSKDLTLQQSFPPAPLKGLSPTAESNSDNVDEGQMSYSKFSMVSTVITQPAAPSQCQVLSPTKDPLCSAYELTTASVELLGEDCSYKARGVEFDAVFGRRSSTEMSDDTNDDDDDWSSSTNLYRSVSSPLISDTSAFATPFSEGFVGTSPFSLTRANPELDVKKRLKRRSQRHLRRDSSSAGVNTSDEAGSKPKSNRPPPGAYDNPRFVQFCTDLRLTNPTRDDYIAFKLRYLGDSVEVKYDGLIEQFLQKAVIYAVQEKLSYQHFSKMSQDLAQQAHRVQERALLVACFGRRLWEKLPEYQETISQFTALTVEEIAADFFLSMGLAPDVNPYDPEICSDYDDWKDVFEKLHGENGAFAEILDEDPFFQRPLEQLPSYATVPRGFQVPEMLRSTSKGDRRVATPTVPQPTCLQLPWFHLRKATSVEVLLVASDSESDEGQSECDGNQTILPDRVKSDPSEERPSPLSLVRMQHGVTAEREQLAAGSPRMAGRTRHLTSAGSDVRTFDSGDQALNELDRGKSSLPGAKPVIITSLRHEVSPGLVAQSVSVVTFQPRPAHSDEFPETFTSSTSSSPDGEVDGLHGKQRAVLSENGITSSARSSRSDSTNSQPQQRRRSSLQVVVDAIIPLAPAISAAVLSLIISSRK